MESQRRLVKADSEGEAWQDPCPCWCLKQQMPSPAGLRMGRRLSCVRTLSGTLSGEGVMAALQYHWDRHTTGGPPAFKEVEHEWNALREKGDREVM